LPVHALLIKSRARYGDEKMKLTELFARKKPRRKPTHLELATLWSTRDWADLPHHHPRRD